jgi:CRISPR-associated protein Csm3
MSDEIKLSGKLIINGKITTETGLHIGGTAETLKIGGSDNPVIRDKNGNIFIPGSSLKGKIRSLMEISGYSNQKYKKGEPGAPCDCGNCNVCLLFGPHNSDNIQEPVRVIVRDAYIIRKGNKSNYEYLEIKPENKIDRVSGTTTTGGVRNIERVVAGSDFEYEIIFNIYNTKDKDLIIEFIEGMRLLEDDYLGGSGSRGSGKIIFKDLGMEHRHMKYYEGEQEADSKNVESIDKLMEEIKNLSI